MRTHRLAVTAHVALTALASLTACDEETYAQYESSSAVTTGASTTQPETTKPESSAPETTNQGDPWANQWLTWNGYGPVQLGMTYEQLKAKGLAEMHQECQAPRPTDEVGDKGIHFYINPNEPLTNISFTGETISTAAGARVGISEAELKDIYGSRLKSLPSGIETFGQTGHYMEQDGKVMAFLFDKDKLVLIQLIKGGITDFSPLDGC